MKLTALFVMVFLVQVSAKTHGQVTIVEKRASLEKIMHMIEEQTDYVFFYKGNLTDVAIDVTAYNLPVDEVLDICFRDLPLTYKLIGKTIVVSHLDRKSDDQSSTLNPLIEDDIEVQGSVVDSMGRPLSGATVRIKGSRLSTLTNTQGQFRLSNVPDGSILMISFVGYEAREMPAKSEMGAIILNLLTSEIGQIEVMVNTGYQTIPKERATGSFSYIDNELFSQQVGPTIIERLEAIGNGILVDPVHSAKPNLMVRGLSTIEGPKEVLIIVDNFPYEGDINNINPNDVEDITILKDAAAASIWGARAGNGVIVINTKRGQYNQAIRTSVNANLTIGQKPDLYKVPQVSSAGFVEFEKFLHENNFWSSRLNAKPSFQIVSPVIELLIKRDQATSESERQVIDAAIEAYKHMDIRDGMMKYLYQNAVNQQYSVNVSGGASNFAWSASTSVDYNDSELQARYRRFNARFRQTYKPIRNLELSTDIYYTQSGSKNGALGYGRVKQNFNGFYPYSRIADDEGNALGILKTYRKAWTDTVLVGKLLDWMYYPLTDWKHETLDVTVRDVIFNAGLNYRVVNGLALDVKYQYENQYTKTDRLYGVESHEMRTRINMYTQVNPDGTIKYYYPYGSRYQYTHGILNSHQLRGQINLDKRWKDHEVVAIGGGEIRMAVDESTGGGMYGYDAELLSFEPVTNIERPIPTIRGTTSRIGDMTAQPTYRSTRFTSFFMNAAYTWKQKYTISTSGRTDASNLFGLKTNDQWNPFLSFGLSWNISKEDFYSFDGVPYLKLRATYGTSGNIDPAMVATTTVSYARPVLGHRFIPNQIVGYIQNYFNPQLRWETAQQFNVGVDFGTKGRLIQGSIEYFHKRGNDLFGKAMLDYTGGAGRTITKNVSKMKGNGIDLELNARILDKGLQWNTRLNFSMYKDKLVDYYVQTTSASSYVSRLGKAITPGYPISAIFSYRWAGLDPETGDPRSYLNGEISKNYRDMVMNPNFDDLIYHGSSIPTYFGNFVNRFGYKNIELNLALSYKLGYFFRRKTLDLSSMANQGIGHADFDTRWQKPGDELFTDVPSIDYPFDGYRAQIHSNSDLFVHRGDHIRIQYVQLSYQLRKSQIPKLPFQSIRIYANANNLGLLWRANKYDIDPDFIYDYQDYGMPTISSYSFGIHVNF